MNGTPYPNQPRGVTGPDPLSREEMERELTESRNWRRTQLENLRKYSMMYCRRQKKKLKAMTQSLVEPSHRSKPVVYSDTHSSGNIHTLEDSRSHPTVSFSHSGLSHLENDFSFEWDGMGSDSADSDVDWHESRNSRARSLSRGHRLGGLHSVDTSDQSGATRASRPGGRLRRQRDVSRESAIATQRSDREQRAKRAAERAAKRAAAVASTSQTSGGDAIDELSEAGSDSDDEAVFDDQGGASESEEERDNRRKHKRGQKSASARRARNPRTRASSDMPSSIDSNEDDVDALPQAESQMLSPARRVSYRGRGRRVLGPGIVVDRSWLEFDQPRTQYTPQVGDEVYYFAQGHMEHLREFPEHKSPPWLGFQRNWPVVQCRIDSISYEFPTAAMSRRCSSLLAVVNLTVTGYPTRWNTQHAGLLPLDFSPPKVTRHRGSENNAFSVTLRKYQLPDYLVPDYQYVKAMRVQWREQMRIEVDYVDGVNENNMEITKTYSGIIQGIGDSDPDSWPDSPWNCLEIKWYSEEERTDSVSPWEACHYAHLDLRIQVENLPRLADDISVRILRLVRKLSADELFKEFSAPVDRELFPDYYSIIPLPMDLGLVERRLESGYYRKVNLPFTCTLPTV